MDQVRFNAEVKKDPDFQKTSCQAMPVDCLRVEEDGGQVRSGGIDPKHVKKLEADLWWRGQFIPITITDKPDADGKYVIQDGNHRFKAFEQINRDHPKSLGFKTILAYKQRPRKKIADQLGYQIKSNLRNLPSKGVTNEDIAHALMTVLQREDCDGITWKNFYSDESNFEKLLTWLQGNWEIPAAQGKSVIKQYLKSAPGSKLVNYTKEEVLQEFSNHNTYGWSGKKPGDKCNGYVVYPVGSDSHIFPNVTGNSFKKKTNDGPNTKTIVIGWESNTMGKTAKDIAIYRRSIVNKVNNANKSWLLAVGATMVDELVFVPQKIKEKKGKLLNSVKDSNGDFTTNFV